MAGLLKTLERSFVRPLVRWLRPARDRAAGGSDAARDELLVALVQAEVRRGGREIDLPGTAGAELRALVLGLLAAPAGGRSSDADRDVEEEEEGPVAGSVGPAARQRRAA